MEYKLRSMRVVLAKINFIPNLWSQSPNECMKHLCDYLIQNNNREFSRFRHPEDKWALSETDMYHPEGAEQPILRGKLGRKTLAKTTEFAPGEGFKTDTTTNWVVCNFIIDPVSEYLLFEERRPEVTMNLFISAFSDLCRLAGEEYGFLNVNLKVDRQHIWQRLEMIDKIFMAKIQYHMPNPRIRQTYQDLLDDLKANGALSGIRVYANPSGLNVSPEFLRSMVDLSSDGYGKYSLRVQEKNGARTTLTSAKDVIADTIEATDDPADFAARFYHSLQRLKERSQNEK